LSVAARTSDGFPEGKTVRPTARGRACMTNRPSARQRPPAGGHPFGRGRAPAPPGLVALPPSGRRRNAIGWSGPDAQRRGAGAGPAARLTSRALTRPPRAERISGPRPRDRSAASFDTRRRSPPRKAMKTNYAGELLLTCCPGCGSAQPVIASPSGDGWVISCERCGWYRRSGGRWMPLFGADRVPPPLPTRLVVNCTR